MTFDEYFSQVYGERWPELLNALKAEPRKRVLKNPFGSPYQDYSLDEASLWPARCLDARKGEYIADFCAAPGGKLLALIFSLEGEARFFANELSQARMARLKAILHDTLPEDVMARVRPQKGDAALLGKKFPAIFDRILVDAPCSGERHLLSSPNELQRWSLKGSKRLAVRQNALLCAAIDAVKPGGRVVYSTCSISPLENDSVIERLSRSRSGKFKVLKIEGEMGEPTEHGWLILPDKYGCGPIYTAVLERSLD